MISRLSCYLSTTLPSARCRFPSSRLWLSFGFGAKFWPADYATLAKLSVAWVSVSLRWWLNFALILLSVHYLAYSCRKGSSIVAWNAFDMVLMVIRFVLCFVSILIAFAIHELAHGFMADRLGDPTPKYEGRLTLNPLKHLDITGALVLMVSLLLTHGKLVLGWGKPVRYSSEAMRNPMRDGGLVALAGPLSNFAFMLCAGLPVKLGVLHGLPLLEDAFAIFAAVNAAMFVFNCLPFPPLDGWKILQLFVPNSLAYKMQDLEARWGMAPLYVLMALMFLMGGKIVGPLYALVISIFVGRLPL